MMDTRDSIVEFVHADPGVHFSELVRELDLATGQVQYHVEKLHKKGTIIAEEYFGRTHYFPDGYDEWERRTLALLRRETAAHIVAVVLAEEDVSPTTVADELDIARSTVTWHINRLVDGGVIERHRSGRRVRLSPTRPAPTVELLAKAHQPLPERLVDRFIRLIDRLLED